MVVGQHRRAVGVFDNRRDAEHALTELRDAAFNMDKISVIARNAGTDEQMAGAEVSKTPEEQAKGGAEAGATAGAATGGLIGLIGSLGLLAIPGIGVAAELGLVLGGTLLGSGIGAASGGLLGALIGWGVPEDQAQYYDEQVTQGYYLVVVEGSDAEIRTAEAILNRRGIRNWGVYDAPISPAGRL